MLRKAIFLDRDGVINRSLVRNGLPIAPNSLDLFEIIPEAKESINMLKKNFQEQEIIKIIIFMILQIYH